MMTDRLPISARPGTITRIDYEDGTKTFRASAGFPETKPTL